MKVVKRSGRGYAQDPTKFLNFSRFAADGPADVSVVEGAFEEHAGWEQFNLSPADLAAIRASKVVRLEFEEPNKFFLGDDQDSYDRDFHRVFTICPYTAKWLNERQGADRRVPICFPFNEEYVPPKHEKRFDVIYTGHIVAKPVFRDIEVMRGFNYRFVSNSPHPYVTNQSATYEEKMALIAQSRITLVNNLLYPKLYHLFNIWRYRGWRSHGAFSQLPGPTGVLRFLTQRSRMIVPQLKSRLFEAAFGRSLILCRRDPFNVAERFFEPGKEFVYYEEGDLRNTIAHVLRSWPEYEPVAERAFERAMREYTTAAFFDRYLKPLR